MKKQIMLKQLSYIVMIIVAIAVAVGVGVGVYFGKTGVNEKPQRFDLGELSVTLTNQFKEVDNFEQDYALASKDVIFIVDTVSFSVLQEEGWNVYYLTCENFAQMQIVEHSLFTSVQKDQENDLTYFVYQKNVDGNLFKYKAYILKGVDKFYLCQFACLDKDFRAKDEQFTNWAKSFEYVKGINIQEKVFQKDGVTITLPDKFKETEDSFKRFVLSTNEFTFISEKVPFESLGNGAENLTIQQYVEDILSSNEMNSRLYFSNGLWYFDYSNVVSTMIFKYRAFAFKGNDSFYLCQFSMKYSDFDDNVEQIMAWAKTIVVE